MAIRPFKHVAPPQPASPPRRIDLTRLPAQRQRRMDDLMARNNNGDLADGELEELRELVREAEALTLANARRLAASREPEQRKH